MFLVFLTKERPILTALKQMSLDEIKQSNSIKPPKIYFFMIFCKFLPHTGNFCWNVPSQVIYTFYLKLQKYPCCAPIFPSLSETESSHKGRPPSADLSYRGKDNISPSTLVFATRKGWLWIYTLYLPPVIPKKLALVWR